MAFEKQAEKMKAKADAQKQADDGPLTNKERGRWARLSAYGITIIALYLLWFLYGSNPSFHDHIQQNKDTPLWIIHVAAIILLSVLSLAAWIDWRRMPKGQRREWKAGRYTRVGIALALDGMLLVAYAFYWSNRNIWIGLLGGLVFITGDILYYKGAKLAKADPLGIRKKRK